MTTYREAGVDMDAGDEFVDRIKPLVRSTFRPEVLTDLGGFGGLFRLQSKQYEDPVLVSGTDGVGTKLKIAFLTDRHDTVGIDLVAMCVNDIAVQRSGTAVLSRLLRHRQTDRRQGAPSGHRHCGGLPTRRVAR